MKPREILKHTRHRSFPYPKKPWIFYQEWNRALFLHWEIALEDLQPFVPKPLKIDLINGKAWVSLVAFDMNHIGIRAIPRIPHISDFHEINLRTYIIHNNKPSVYFLNMEGSKKSSCSILKSLSKFPYQHAKMNRNSFSYSSKNAVTNDSFYAEYRLPIQPILKDKTDLWLTERYAVFQDYKNHLIAYDVHHAEWSLETLAMKKLDISYPKFNHILNNSPHRAHYSKGVQVLAWNKRKHAL